MNKEVIEHEEKAKEASDTLFTETNEANKARS